MLRLLFCAVASDLLKAVCAYVVMHSAMLSRRYLEDSCNLSFTIALWKELVSHMLPIVAFRAGVGTWLLVTVSVLESSASWRRS